MTEQRPTKDPPQPQADDLRWFVLLIRQAGYFVLTEIDRRYGLDRPCKKCERERRGSQAHQPKRAA